ncbi:hypothetical protein MtrunA17_Chr6g0460341 [Medicago truncatula]|uniref:Uncharacterized protein n=1 Tax=Medicago truncatula TaxID=3880 RepID=G7KP69_MEDTR|nr:actin-binding protein F [Medicago truncatula]AES75133.1 hypothetical protein MTR_6g026850 [Medicago truncatula]RHN50698.1 hypothetical protein MtrunA17_Chr6g0460341 [Medicago truncatula]
MERGIHDTMDDLKKSEPRHATKEPSSGSIAHDLDSNNYNISPLLNTSSQHKQNQEAKKRKSYSHACSISSSSFHATTSTTHSSKSSSSTSSNKLVGLKYSHLTTNAISPSKKNPSHSNIFIDLYKKIKASLSKPISVIRRKCSCFDKNSLQVKENTSKPKASSSTTLPTPQIQALPQNEITINDVNQEKTPKDKLTTNDEDDDHDHEEEKEEEVRDSLHVFQPTSLPKSNVNDEDVASDSSSDLFEIEGFSTQATTLEYPTKPSMIECQETTTATNVLCDT